MKRPLRTRLAARAAGVLALAVVVPLVAPVTHAVAQPPTVPTPVAEKQIPVNGRVRINTNGSNYISDVVVVSPGIAIQIPGPTDEASRPFVNEIARLIDKIGRTASGRHLLEAARMAPLPDLAGNTGSDYQYVNEAGEPVDIHIVITPPVPGGEMYHSSIFSERYKNGLGAVSRVEFDTTGKLPLFHDHLGNPYVAAPDVILFHELTHSIRYLGGFGVDHAVTTNYVVNNIYNGNPQETVTTPVEEMRTLGNRHNLALVNGMLPGGVDVAADPVQLASLGETVRVLHAIQEAPHLDDATKASLYRQVTDTHLLRGSFGASETTYSEEVGHNVRAIYSFLPGEQTGLWSVTAPDRSTLTAEDFNKPGESTRLQRDEQVDDLPACSGASFICSKRATTRQPTPDEVKAKQDLDALLKNAQVEPRVVWDDPALRELRLDAAERATSARLQVFDMLSSEREFSPSLESVRSQPGKVLLTGPHTAAKLNSAIRTVREVSTGVITDPAVVIGLVAGITEAFATDSSDLDKATAVLMPLPVLGPLLGIVQQVEEGGSAADIAANVINLLAGVALLAGQPELSMVFAVAAVFATVIGQIVDAVNNGFDAQKASRDKGWSQHMTAHLRDVVVPALVKSVDHLFQRVQQGWLNDALMARAVIDATIAAQPGNVAVREAGAKAKADLSKLYNDKITKVRKDFIDSIEPVIKKTVATVNTDDSIKQFNAAYIDANRDRLRQRAYDAIAQCQLIVPKNGVDPCPGDMNKQAEKEVERIHQYLDAHQPPAIDPAPFTAKTPDLIAAGKYFAPLQLSESTTEPFSPRGLYDKAARHFLDGQHADEHGTVSPVNRAEKLTRAGTGHRLTDTNEALWRWDSRSPAVVFEHGFGGFSGDPRNTPYANATWNLLDYTHTGNSQPPGENRHMFFGASRSVIDNGVETVWTPKDTGVKWLYEYHAPAGIDFRATMGPRTITQDRNEIIFPFSPTRQHIRSARLIGVDGTLQKIVTNPHFTETKVDGEYLPDLQCGTTAPVETWNGVLSNLDTLNNENYLTSAGSMKPLPGGCGFTAEPNPSAPIPVTVPKEPFLGVVVQTR